MSTVVPGNEVAGIGRFLLLLWGSFFQIAKKLLMSLSGVEKIVRQLKKEGILSREGSTKAGKWIVKV